MSKPFVALAFVCLLIPKALPAQVGHHPEHSPYRPIAARSSLTAFGGYLAGSAGRLGIGPTDGPLLGVRYEMRLTGPTDATLGISWARLERLIPDPDAPADSQLTGPVKQTVVFVEGGLNILLTGDKTWRRLAPYFGASLGLGFGSGLPADSSGFRYRAKFTTGPMLGFRLYPTDQLMLRLEGRLTFWQLKYPTRFFNSPIRAPTDDPLLDPSTESDSQWTAHPLVLFGLGWAFRL